MTPIRETIARAISGAPFSTARSLGKADAVLRALDEAGCVVVKKEPDDAMVWAGCAEIVREHGRECKRCPPLVETPYGAGTQACRLEAENIYRAMISAAKEPE